MSSAITCASCNRPLRVPEDVLGQTVQCPLCLDEFVAQADPAAEAAARAAEPPARRAARPERVAAHVAAGESILVEAEDEEPVWVEPVAEAAPTKTTGRKTAEGRTLAFPILVTRDPDRVLRGRMDGELTERGLHLRKPRYQPAFAAVGAKARYIRANRLVVTVEGREVELVIDKPWTSTYHLARDVAGFLDGQRGFPEGRAYAVRWYLYCLPALFIALPFAAGPFGLLTDGCLGVFLWCVIAAVLAATSAIVVAQRRLTPRARLIGAGCLLGLGAAVYLVSIPLTPVYTVDASLWKPYTSPDGDFSILLPGAPASYSLPTFNNTKKYSKSIQSPEISFAVYVAPAPPNANNPNIFQPFANPNANAIQNAQNLLKQEFSLGFQYPRVERSLNAYGGHPYEEYYYVVSTMYGGPSAGKSLAAHVYVVNGMTYTLAVFGPRVKSDAPDVLKFFNSFQVKASANPKPAPPPGQPALPAGRQPASPVGMNGLLAYWSFDHVLNGQVLVDDESGNLMTGTLHNATAIPDGPRGQAIHFNGQGSYFDFSDANNLNFRAEDDFTLCGWVRTRAASRRGGFQPAGPERRAGYRCEDRKRRADRRGASGRQCPHPRGELSRGPVVNDGAWHHFALARRHNGGLGATVFLYVDGVRRGGQLNFIADGAVTTDLRALGTELYWQRHGFAGNATFTGEVDEFCVFNRVLDEGEIRRLAGLGGP